MQLDHVTLRTRDLVATREFFLTVFELEDRPRPRAIRHIPGHWLYAGDNPIVHLIGTRAMGLNTAPEAWDHVGFRLQNYDAFRARLQRLGIAFAPMDLPELRERRLFLNAPCGQLIEAVFRNADFDPHT